MEVLKGKELYTTKLEVMKICFRKKEALRGMWFASSGSSTLLCHLDVADEHGCIRQNGGLLQKHCIFFFDSEPMSLWKSSLILCHCVTSIMFSKINCFLMISSCFALIESKAKFIRITTSIHNNYYPLINFHQFDIYITVSININLISIPITKSINYCIYITLMFFSWFSKHAIFTKGHVTWLTSCRSLSPLLGASAPVWNHDIFACGPWKECLGDVETTRKYETSSLKLTYLAENGWLEDKFPFGIPLPGRCELFVSGNRIWMDMGGHGSFFF